MLTVIELTTGVPGAGKSYRRCAHYLVNDWLKDKENRIHYSNFPVDIEAIAEYTSRRDVDEHIKEIPEDVIETWLEGRSGPWEYFQDTDLACCHIALDEFDHFCSTNHKKEIRTQWAAWLKEIRHQGATVEFITQDHQAVAKEVERKVAVRRSLTVGADRRDPYFKIKMYDWYQLRSKLINRQVQTVIETEYRKHDGRWKAEDASGG
ncbi:hypothetical protein JD969_02270 [Planctomycetota bacterium]|nr:hypothetical protein JD969_02270 [Planctomycetota bacterium]